MENSQNTPLSEEELLALIAQGDRDAFRQLYKLYYHKLYTYVIRFIKSPYLAEDIIQDVFLKIWENRHHLSYVKSPGPYLYAIGKNTTLNMLSRAAREAKIRDLILAATPGFINDTEHQIQQKEYERLLALAIESLPPQRQKVFRMCKIEGKSYEEAARILGIGTGTVNDHIVKATRRLREFLKAYDIDLIR